MNHHDYAVIDNSRIQKAKKIIACLEYYTNDKLRGKRVLDVGAGSCLISNEISKLGNEVICIDFDEETYRETNNRYNISNNTTFSIDNGKKLPFKQSSFDIVICNQVIEHIPRTDHLTIINESYRVLRTGGLFYIATPNKLWPIEPHTGLLFLSYMPRKLADKYIKLVKGTDEYLLTYNQMKKIVMNKFKNLIDLTPTVIKDLEGFYNESEIPNLLKPLLRIIPIGILRLLTPFYPSWIVIGAK